MEIVLDASGNQQHSLSNSRSENERQHGNLRQRNVNNFHPTELASVARGPLHYTSDDLKRESFVVQKPGTTEASSEGFV